MYWRSLSTFRWPWVLGLSGFCYCLLSFTAQMLLSADLFADDSVIASKQSILSRKTQEELGKAVEALRINAPAKARKHLEAVYRVAPNNTDINYFMGVYSSQTNDWNQAKVYWFKTINLDPKHSRALLALSDRLLCEDQPTD